MTAKGNVDIEALRAKYGKLADERTAIFEAALAGNALAAECVFEGSSTVKDGVRPFEHPVGSKLDTLSICIACQGLGSRNSLYNHTVVTRTCTDCYGEGVITSATSSLLSSGPTASCKDSECSASGKNFECPN